MLIIDNGSMVNMPSKSVSVASDDNARLNGSLDRHDVIDDGS